MQSHATHQRARKRGHRKHEAKPAVASQMERMLDGVRAAGLKLTPQRIAIVRELAADESHPTAQELYDRLRPALPTMSFATVYNTLDALTAAGLCAALALSPGSGRFDPNMQPHHHLVCDACGAVRDLPAPIAPATPAPEEAAMRRAASRAAPGFEVRSVERILRGLCVACARHRARSAASDGATAPKAPI
jgi:Fur family peroxide stress response transcriptional regulator